MYDDTNLLPCPFCGNKTALHVGPDGSLREDGRKLLEGRRKQLNGS